MRFSQRICKAAFQKGTHSSSDSQRYKLKTAIVITVWQKYRTCVQQIKLQQKQKQKQYRVGSDSVTAYGSNCHQFREAKKCLASDYQLWPMRLTSSIQGCAADMNYFFPKLWLLLFKFAAQRFWLWKQHIFYNQFCCATMLANLCASPLPAAHFNAALLSSIFRSLLCLRALMLR